MIKFIFTNKAKKSFQKLTDIEKIRIKNTLRKLKNNKNIGVKLLKSIGLNYATHKLKIYKYKLLLIKLGPIFLIAKIISNLSSQGPR